MAKRGGRRFTIEVVSDTKKFTSGMKGFLRSMSGTMAGLGLAMGGREVIRGIQSTITAASDLQESMNAVEKVFGRSAKSIKDFGRISAREVGLSAEAFQSLTVVLGSTLINKGIKDAAGATIELTKRASDMASVFNTDVSQAMEAIGSLFQGQSRPIREYGVNILQADVNSRALAESGKSVVSSLTDQEKALATLHLVMEQTASTEGDFKATQDDLANAMRTAQATWTDLQAALGESALPLATQGVLMLTEALRDAPMAIANVDSYMHDLAATYQDFASTMATNYTLGIFDTSGWDAGSDKNRAIVKEIEARKRYLEVIQAGGDEVDAYRQSILSLVKAEGMNLTSQDNLRQATRASTAQWVISMKEIRRNADSYGLTTDQLAALETQIGRVEHSWSMMPSMSPQQAQERQWKDYAKAMGLVGTELEDQMPAWGEYAGIVGQASEDAASSLSGVTVKILGIRDAINQLDDPFKVWDYGSWGQLEGSLVKLRGLWEDVLESIQNASAAGRGHVSSIPPAGQIGGRDAGGPATQSVSINFNGVVGDPVAVGREVQDVLSQYATARGGF